jgi:hypothetical protein
LGADLVRTKVTVKHTLHLKNRNGDMLFDVGFAKKYDNNEYSIPT